MASIIPAPIFDLRSEDEVAAQAISALPSELSDRSDSSPAVVIIEANAYVMGRLQYQLNRWPAGVVQNSLNLLGVTVRVAQAATVTQRFTLSAPRSSDSAIFSIIGICICRIIAI